MAGATTITVLLADDQRLFRKGARRLLEDDGRFKVVGEAADGRAALELYREHRPDVLVTDFVMPGKDGLDLTKELLCFFPDANVLVLTAHGDADHASRALRAGARGFLAKSAEPADLVTAVAAVARGERYLEHALAVSLVELSLGPGEDPRSRLTDREFQVMRLIAAGLRSREIARQLAISHKTVDTHRANVLRKLGLETNADIARYAMRHGLIEG